jgi:uncharacterized protein YodC (DUF2158 family)
MRRSDIRSYEATSALNLEMNMAEETTFEVGDLVQLRSGGPIMTVSWVQPGRDELTCHWFNDATAEFLTTRFVPATLAPVEG